MTSLTNQTIQVKKTRREVGTDQGITQYKRNVRKQVLVSRSTRERSRSYMKTQLHMTMKNKRQVKGQ